MNESVTILNPTYDILHGMIIYKNMFENLFESIFDNVFSLLLKDISEGWR